MRSPGVLPHPRATSLPTSRCLLRTSTRSEASRRVPCLHHRGSPHSCGGHSAPAGCRQLLPVTPLHLLLLHSGLRCRRRPLRWQHQRRQKLHRPEARALYPPQQQRKGQCRWLRGNLQGPLGKMVQILQMPLQRARLQKGGTKSFQAQQTAQIRQQPRQASPLATAPAKILANSRSSQTTAQTQTKHQRRLLHRCNSSRLPPP
mmetsp:Transcript_6704/g.19283  ORF Transcript_6704/g.19283 Transcript_6704/m.19283 type:complete len:203 (+) Transcript_6704:2271-2879(+)